MEAGLPCSLSTTTIFIYLHRPDTYTLTASLKSYILAMGLYCWLSSDTITYSIRMDLPFLGCKYNSVTKVRLYNLNRMSIGAMANSVDSQLTMLRVGLWNACVAVCAKLEEDTSSYSTSAMANYYKDIATQWSITARTFLGQLLGWAFE